MVITVQGYNNKNNKAVFVTSVLAAFTGLAAREKTLVIQCIDNDIDCVENTLLKRNIQQLKTGEMEFLNDGIDTLLRSAQVTKLSRDDFAQTVTPLLESENRLDVLKVSRNKKFSESILQKLDELESLIKDAKNVYQHIYILLPAKNIEIVKAVNGFPMVDKSVYCIRQGHSTTADVYGKKIVYVAPEFENQSVFSVKAMKKIVSQGKRNASVSKITHNVFANDAAMKGQLLKFVKNNLDVPETDVNYTWREDITGIVDMLLSGADAQEKAEPEYAQETINKKPHMVTVETGERYKKKPPVKAETSVKAETPVKEIPQKPKPPQEAPEMIQADEAQKPEKPEKPAKKEKKAGFFLKRKEKVPTALNRNPLDAQIDKIMEELVQEDIKTAEDLEIEKNGLKTDLSSPEPDGYVEHIGKVQEKEKKSLFAKEKKKKKEKLPGGWRTQDTCYMVTAKKQKRIEHFTVQGYDGKYYELLDKNGKELRASFYRMHHTREDALASLESKQ